MRWNQRYWKEQRALILLHLTLLPRKSIHLETLQQQAGLATLAAGGQPDQLPLLTRNPRTTLPSQRTTETFKLVSSYLVHAFAVIQSICSSCYSIHLFFPLFNPPSVAQAIPCCSSYHRVIRTAPSSCCSIYFFFLFAKYVALTAHVAERISVSDQQKLEAPMLWLSHQLMPWPIKSSIII